jgi:hypothetical protein
LEKWNGTDTTNALEKRDGTNPADTVERNGTDTANALVS